MNDAISAQHDLAVTLEKAGRKAEALTAWERADDLQAQLLRVYASRCARRRVAAPPHHSFRSSGHTARARSGLSGGRPRGQRRTRTVASSDDPDPAPPAPRPAALSDGAQQRLTALLAGRDQLAQHRLPVVFGGLDGSPRSVRELAAATSIARSAVYRYLDELVQAGLAQHGAGGFLAAHLVDSDLKPLLVDIENTLDLNRARRQRELDARAIDAIRMRTLPPPCTCRSEAFYVDEDGVRRCVKCAKEVVPTREAVAV